MRRYGWDYDPDFRREAAGRHWRGERGRRAYTGFREGGAGYGGAAPGRDARRGAGGWGWPERRGYEEEYAREPFIPEQVYRRHPEFTRSGPPHGADAPWREPVGARPRALRFDDEEVAQRVREGLYADPYLDPSRIQVTVEDGVVTLRGEVDDFMEARYAWDDAWETPGVRGVLNHLVARPAAPEEDAGGV